MRGIRQSLVVYCYGKQCVGICQHSLVGGHRPQTTENPGAGAPGFLSRLRHLHVETNSIPLRPPNGEYLLHSVVPHFPYTARSAGLARGPSKCRERKIVTAFPAGGCVFSLPSSPRCSWRCAALLSVLWPVCTLDIAFCSRTIA